MIRHWSDDGLSVQAYRILVSHPGVPEWASRPIRGLAYQNDLYTTVVAGREIDETENWIEKEFETPGLRAVDRLLDGTKLHDQEWKRVGRLVAAQDLRTPLNYFESMRRWDQDLPELVKNTLHKAINRISEATAQGIKLVSKNETTPLSDLFRVRIENSIDGNPETAGIHAEIALDRRLWIASMRHILAGRIAKIFSQHKWSLVQPYGDEEWPLTDHPVLRLNYNGPEQYDFGGGWGNPGSEIMMPISPRFLLYAQVGRAYQSRFIFPQYETHLVQRLMVERAYRWVFARRPLPWVSAARPRIVSAELVFSEEQAWKDWHQDQLRIQDEA